MNYAVFPGDFCGQIFNKFSNLISLCNLKGKENNMKNCIQTKIMAIKPDMSLKSRIMKFGQISETRS